MKIHEQKSNKARHPFWNLEVIDNEDRTISIPAGSFYIQGQKYDLEAVKNEPFPVGTRLFVEKTEEGADYFIDLTGHDKPKSFGEGIGATLVVWNHNEEIHCLRSIRL